MAVSVFDLLKIGIGPNSSHAVGPMRAARIKCSLYGSLGAAGKGHGSDKAVLLGLLGGAPDSVEIDAVPALLQATRLSVRVTRDDPGRPLSSGGGLPGGQRTA